MINLPHSKKIFFPLILGLLLFPVAIFADEASPAPAETSSAAASLSQPTVSPDAPATFKERKDKEGYVLNLKDLIKESKKKIETVNDKLKDQAQQRRNQQREEKAREYYEKAMHLFDEGRLEEAQELWHKAIKITEHPEMKDYISESVKKSRKQEDLLLHEEQMRVKELEVERGYSAKEVEAAYQRAVELYKKQDYLDAKEAFEKVDQMFPDHKATRSYLMVLDQEIQKEQQRLIDERLENKVVSKRKEKEEWRRRLEEKEQQQQMTLEEQAEAAYREAVKLYKDRNFSQAKDKFREVEWILPNYKSTPQYLSRIDRDIKEEEKRLALQGNREKDAELDDRLTDEKKDKDLKKKERAYKSQEEVSRVKDEADFVYETALNLYHNKDYARALDKFKEVDQLYPNYKKTENYISNLNKLLKIEEDKTSKKQLAQFEKELKEAKRAVYQEQERQSKSNQFKADLSTEKVLDEAEILYNAAVDLFKSNLYKQASAKFNDVEKIQPDYKLTRRYQQRLDRLLDAGEGKVESTEINDLVRLDSKLTSEDESIQKAITEREEKKRQEAEDKYKQAVKFYKSESYVEAKLKFIQVEALMPDYKDVGDYLDHIDDDIAKSRKTKKFNHLIKMEAPSMEKPARKQPVSTQLKPEISKDLPEQSMTESKKFEIGNNDVITQEKSKSTAVKKLKKMPLPLPEKTDEDRYNETNSSLINVAQIKAKDEFYKESQMREYTAFQKKLRQEQQAIEQAEKLHRDRRQKIKDDLKKKMLEEEKRKKKERLLKEKEERKSVKKELKEPPEKVSKTVLADNEKTELENKKKTKDARPFKEKIAFKDKVKEEAVQEVESADKKTTEGGEEMIDPGLSKSQRERLRRLKKLEEIRQQTEKEMVALQVDADQKVVSENREELSTKETSVPERMGKKISSNEKVSIPASKKESDYSTDKIKDDELADTSPAYHSEEVRRKYHRRVALKQLKHIRLAENKLVQKQKKIIHQQTRKIKSQLVHQKKTEQRRWSGETERVYTKALQLFKDGRYAAARTEFESVEQMNEEYKSTRYYLDEIDRILEEQKQTINKEEDNAQETSIKKEIRKNRLKVKEARKAEEARRIEEIRKAKEEEKVKKAEEAKKIREAEEFQKAEEARKTEEARKAKEVKNKKADKIKEVKEIERSRKAKESNEAGKIVKAAIIKEPAKVENLDKMPKIVKAEKTEIAPKIKKTEKIKESLQKENEDLRRNIFKNELAYKKEMEALEIRKLKEERLFLKEKEAASKRANLEALARVKALKIEKEKLQKKEPDLIRIENKNKMKQKEADEKRRQNEEMIRMRREIDVTYQDALNLTRLNKIELAREKFKKLDQLITTSRVPENYRKSMRQRMDQGRSRLEIMFEREREKNERIAKKESEKVTEKEIQTETKEAAKEVGKETAKGGIIAEKANEIQDIEALRKKIEDEDQKLAKEKEAEALRLKNEEAKKEKIEKQKAEKVTAVDKVSKKPEQKSIHEVFLSEKEEIKKAEEGKRRELESLVRQRQEELRLERLRMIDELNQSVDHLYNKAQNLYDSGYYSEAKSLFIEVEDLKPGYKKTTIYLNKIAAQNKMSSSGEQQIQVPQKLRNKPLRKSKKVKTRQDLIDEALNSVETKSN